MTLIVAFWRIFCKACGLRLRAFYKIKGETIRYRRYFRYVRYRCTFIDGQPLKFLDKGWFFDTIILLARVAELADAPA